MKNVMAPGSILNVSFDLVIVFLSTALQEQEIEDSMI